jgi:hypothetical protein
MAAAPSARLQAVEGLARGSYSLMPLWVWIYALVFWLIQVRRCRCAAVTVLPPDPASPILACPAQPSRLPPSPAGRGQGGGVLGDAPLQHLVRRVLPRRGLRGAAVAVHGDAASASAALCPRSSGTHTPPSPILAPGRRHINTHKLVNMREASSPQEVRRDTASSVQA